jgi:hypothetical protein
MTDSFDPLIELIHRQSNHNGMHEDCWVIIFKLGDDVLYANLSSNTLPHVMTLIKNMSEDLTSVYRDCPISIKTKSGDEFIESWDDEKLIYITLKYS